MVGVRWAVFVATVSAFAWFMTLTGQMSLMHRAHRAYAAYRLSRGTMTELRPSDCERYQLRPSARTVGPATRNADGHAIYGDGGREWLVVGDSIAGHGFAAELHAALEAAGRSDRITDTSVAGYDWVDERCAAQRAMSTTTFDVAVVVVCINDIDAATQATLDLGGGEHRYSVVSGVNANPRGLPPLLLDSSHPWVVDHRALLDERFGSKLVYDLADERVLSELASQLPGTESADQLNALLEQVSTIDDVVFVVVPLLYAPPGDPTKPVFDWVIDHLGARGTSVVDLRPTFERIGAHRLLFGEGAMRMTLDEYDLVHPNRGGLAVAAAKSVEATRLPERERVAAAAVERAADWLKVGRPCIVGEGACP